MKNKLFEIDSEAISGEAFKIVLEDKFSLDQLGAVLGSMKDLMFEIDKFKCFVYCFQPTSPDLVMPVENLIRKNFNDLPFSEDTPAIMREGIDKKEATMTAQLIDHNIKMNNEVKWSNRQISRVVDKIKKWTASLL